MSVIRVGVISAVMNTTKEMFDVLLSIYLLLISISFSNIIFILNILFTFI